MPSIVCYVCLGQGYRSNSSDDDEDDDDGINNSGDDSNCVELHLVFKTTVAQFTFTQAPTVSRGKARGLTSKPGTSR